MDGAVRTVLATSREGRLTIVEIGSKTGGGGSGSFAHALLHSLAADEVAAQCIEELVVCGSPDSDVISDMAGAGPVPVSAWKSACKKPAQLSALRRALLKSGRSRVAIVSASPSAALALRCVQLHRSLPASLLVLLAPEPPAASSGGSTKAVFCAGHQRLTLSQLPKKEPSRSEAWRAFLRRGADGGASEAGADDGLVVAWRQAAAEEAGARTGRGADEAAEEGGCELLFPTPVLSAVDQLLEVRQLVDRAVLGPHEGGERGGALTLRDGRRARLARSSPARYAAVYAVHHYVPQPPSEQSACYELYVAASAGGAGGARASGELAAGFIAFLPYGASEPQRRRLKAASAALEDSAIAVASHGTGCRSSRPQSAASVAWAPAMRLRGSPRAGPKAKGAPPATPPGSRSSPRRCRGARCTPAG